MNLIARSTWSMPLCRSCAPHPSATIVNIASTSAVMPMAGTTGYSASKAGLAMFTKCLAFDLGASIHANTICPGVITTGMTATCRKMPSMLPEQSG